ncbi:MAG: DUF364 domain-containing protein [Thermodesulfobacteriota bacterium]
MAKISALSDTVSYLKSELAAELKEIRLERLVIGVFFTGVKLSTGQGGVAFTPIGEMPEAVCCPTSAARMPQAGRMTGRPIEEVLDYARDKNVLKAAMGVAAANAVSQYLWQKQPAQGFLIEPEMDAIEGVDFSIARTVTLVGAFTPFIKLLKEQPCQLYILEKNPQALKEDELKYFRPPEAAAEVLPQSDVAILTGTTIVNHTIDGLLDLCPRSCQVVVAGPTASMIPLAFFKRGVNLMGGMEITDPDTTLDILAEGGGAYHLFGKYARKLTFKTPH